MKRNIFPFRYLPIAVGLIAIFLWFGWAWYVTTRFPEGIVMSEEVQQVAAVRGQFGDMFGGINALFTALILAGAIYTIWLQHKELEALKQQQDSTKDDSDRTALLMAYSGLVNAKSSLLNARYQMMRDFAPQLKDMDPQSEQTATIFLMLEAHANAAGKVMTEVESLAEDLSLLIDKIRKP